MQSIQDRYPSEFAHCYGCGRANPHGHQLKTFLIDDTTVARFTPDVKYSGGVPDHVYGGLIASLLDCHGTASAAGFAAQSADRQTQTSPPDRFVTASLKIDFKRPTPLGVELELRGKLVELQGRKARIALELLAKGEVCASAEMLAVRLQS